jgi:hypothetical protein
MELDSLFKLHIKNVEITIDEKEALELYSLLRRSLGIMNSYPDTIINPVYPVVPGFPQPNTPIWVVDPDSQPWYCQIGDPLPGFTTTVSSTLDR